jgi:hypothetical protein
MDCFWAVKRYRVGHMLAYVLSLKDSSLGVLE